MSGNGTATLTLTGTNLNDFQSLGNVVEFDATSPHSGTRTLTWSFNDDAGGNANDSNSLITMADAEFGPILTTTPSPNSVTLSNATPTPLTDTATVSGGTSPTGSVTFTLMNPLGAIVDTESVTVTGDGTYTTPTGYTLPTTGTVAGTYQWDASYSGDSNNTPTSDNNNSNEQVVVSAANPEYFELLNRLLPPPSAPPSPTRPPSPDWSAPTPGHGHLQPLQLPRRRTAPRRCSPTPRRFAFSRHRHGHLGQLHRHGHRHRLLGRHLQRRRQQQRRHQRRRPRAGGHQPGHPDDQHQPAAGQRHRRHLRSPTRPPSRAATTRPARSPSTSTTTRRHRHAAVHRRQRGRCRRRGHLGRLHRHRHRHRLLGRHLQRRQQQHRRHQRHRPGAGDHHAGHPDDQHQPAAGQRHRRQLDRRQGHRQRRYSPTGTVTFNLYNNSTGTGTPLFTDANVAARRRRGHLGRLHRHRHRHRLLGRHLQRRQQQQRRHQRHRPRAGDHHPGHPDDQHQPAAGQRHRRHARSPTRPRSRGGYNPTGTVTFNLYNNSERHRHAAVHRRQRAARRRRGHLARATPPRPPAPTTGSPPTTATATTTPSPAARPASR